jgi:hypothetical protein
MVIVKEENKEQRIQTMAATQNVKHKRRHLETKERKGRKWDKEREKSGRRQKKKRQSRNGNENRRTAKRE